MIFVLLSLLSFISFVATEPASLILHEDDQWDIVKGQYIVVYKEVDEKTFSTELEQAANRYNVLHNYHHVFKGFAAALTDEQLEEVRQNPLVSYVEVDQVVRVYDCSEPVPVESWGLTRISERKLNLDDKYSYPESAGEGVIAYVIDTGIYVKNEDFEGRATFGFKASSSWSSTDSNGHGTHVASTIVGKAYGVARKATVVGVKVLGDDGRGDDSTVIAGIDWVLSQYLQNKTPSVANLSLGGRKSNVLNAAVNAAVKGGVVVIVAAGNDNRDACDFSPASASAVVSVGSIETGINEDVRSYFSNYGKCVHIFAPGSSITAAWIGSPTATRTISGTSMASPHVAGVAALLLGEKKNATPEQIKDELIKQATANMVKLECPTPSESDCPYTPNLLLFNGCDRF